MRAEGSILAVAGEREPFAGVPHTPRHRIDHIKVHLHQLHAEVVLPVLGHTHPGRRRDLVELLGAVPKVGGVPLFQLVLPPVVSERAGEFLLAADLVGVGADLELDVVVGAVVADLDVGLVDPGEVVGTWSCWKKVAVCI